MAQLNTSTVALVVSLQKGSCRTLSHINFGVEVAQSTGSWIGTSSGPAWTTALEIELLCPFINDIPEFQSDPKSAKYFGLHIAILEESPPTFKLFLDQS